MRAIIVCLTCLITAPAWADEMQLAEMRYLGGRSVTGSPIEMLFRATAGETVTQLSDTFPASINPRPGTISRSVTINDPAELALLQTVFTSPESVFFWDSAGTRTFTNSIHNVFSLGDVNYTGSLAVTPQGIGLTGYAITSAKYDTQVTYFGGLSTFTYQAIQEISLFGVAVPEPATWLLVAIVGAAWPSRRRK